MRNGDVNAGRRFSAQAQDHADVPGSSIANSPSGAPIALDIAASFHVGIGFTSHLPGVAETATLTNVVLENSAGHVR